MAKRVKEVARRTLRGIALTVAIGAIPSMAFATPSTTYWAPSVATCQAFGVPHVTYDTYYGKGAGTAYPIDTGLTMGVSPSSKIQAEIGYDALFPTTNPVGFYLNGKVCTPESSLFKGSPGIGVGIYNIGFHGESDPVPTNYNTLYLMAQKALPIGGYVAAGYYRGLGPDSLYVSSKGEVHKQGFLGGWASPDIKVGLTGLQKLVIAADVQTGKNVFGAGGVGVYVYFNDYVDLLVGPVFYADKALQPTGGKSYLWTTQIDVDIPLGRKSP